MSHFYAEIQGTKGVASRCGDKSNGIWGHIRGWNDGIYIDAEYNKDKEMNIYNVYKSSGSNNNNGKTLLFKLEGDIIVFPNGIVKNIKGEINE